MKVEQQILENHHAKIIVEVEPEQIEKAKQQAARRLANRVKIPGFRPGKAPYNIIERTLGLDAILQQTYESMGEEIYPKALDETGLNPYAPAKFTPPSELAPTIFEFTFPLDAVVDLGDYSSIRIPYELPDINEEEVEKTLTDLQERNAVIEPVERAAQIGDEITIKLSGKRTRPAEGEDTILVNERSQTILIKDEDDSNEWPFQGFSKQMAGLSAGDEKTVTNTFPEDSSYTSLRGKEVEYHLVVEQVKSRILPELNDEFAKSIGDFETLQALKETISDGLKTQAKMSYDSEYSEKVLTQVIQGATIQYPPEMVEDQITASIERIKNQLADKSQELDTYLKLRGIDIAQLREQNRPQAETAITRSVVLYELAQKEGLSVERDEMENEALNTLNNLMRYIPPERFKQMSKDRNFISQLSRNASVDVLSRKTYERLNAIAKGEVSDSEIVDSDDTTDEAAASNDTADESVASEAVADVTVAGETAASETTAAESTTNEIATNEVDLNGVIPQIQTEIENPVEKTDPQEEETISAEIPVPDTTQQEG